MRLQHVHKSNSAFQNHGGEKLEVVSSFARFVVLLGQFGVIPVCLVLYVA